MKAKHQRLVLAVIALVAVLGAGLFGAAALRKEAAYFYTPGKLIAAKPSPGTALRLGGMVERGSVVRAADGVTIAFVATDGTSQVKVRYRGIVPDLFAEGTGMVADGTINPSGVFVANRILAKHDARYMPPTVARDMAKSGDTVSVPVDSVSTR